jgi:hypothetical protein
MEAPSRCASGGLLPVSWAVLLGLALINSLVVADAQAQLFRRAGSPPAVNSGQSGARFSAITSHFEVVAPDPVLARKIGQEAERFRKELAVQWLGHELGEWEDKCPIYVELSMHSGGETSFAFVTDSTGSSRPRSWRMNIFGTPERLLDSVLPHEVTHTIFASHFGRPLPRWADEGACTIVEHESERAKNHQMLIDFLHNNRGIPFNRMFEMKQYPNDILPLYAQGHSLSKFLVMKKGRRHFLDYIADGMQNEERGPLLAGWNRSTEEFYGYRDLSALQESWINWVRSGSQETELAEHFQTPSVSPRTMVAAPVPASRDLTQRQQESNSDRELQTSSYEADANVGQPVQYSSNSWYVRQSRGQRELSQRLPLDASVNTDAGNSDERLTFQPMESIDTNSSESLKPQSEPAETIWR